PECVPVLGARRARALRLEAVDYGAAAHEHELVAPHRDLTRDRVAGEASVLVETIAHSGEELRRIEGGIGDDAVDAHLVEPATSRSAPRRRRARDRAP